MKQPTDFHPAQATLLAYAAGRLSSDERQHIEKHVGACLSCCARARNFGPWMDARPAEPAPARELPEILAAVRRHEAKRLAEDSDALKRRSAHEIGIYLGPGATERMMQGVAPDCRNLLTVVQPILGLFLGRRAAGRLATHIVETSF